MVLGGDGGTIGRRARLVPALRVGPHATAARPAGPPAEGLCAAGEFAPYGFVIGFKAEIKRNNMKLVIVENLRFLFSV